MAHFAQLDAYNNVVKVHVVANPVITDEDGKVIINEDKSMTLILKRKVDTDTRLKRKYRDKYWENVND